MEPYTFELAERKDAIPLHKMMEQVWNGLPDKNIYVCDDLEFVQRHIEKEGFTILAKDSENQIAGGFIFRFPGLAEDNLGRDIGLPEEKLTQVVHLESAVVERKHRGQGLQVRMLQVAERMLAKEKYHYYIATVSPENPASFLSLEKSGYRLIMTKEKYDGRMRHIYCKEV